MWKIPLFKIFWDEEDIEAVNRVIRRGSYWCIGEEIEKFEGIVANYVGRKFGVSYNSGTSALHATMLALGIKPREEVIVPSFTFIATANSPLFVGARPIFADIEESTYGLDPKSVEERITSKTRALLPIHYGGLPCHIEELRMIATNHGLLFIEDAAEALGASIHDKKTGSFGDVSILSFCQNKIITTGEGGMALTDSRHIYEKLKQIRSHGRYDAEPYFSSAKSSDYLSLGYNWRIPSMAASLGISQMHKIEKLIEMRKRNAEYMTARLSRIEGIRIPAPPKGHNHVYQMYTVETEHSVREGLRKFLEAKGIMTKVYFDPVHLTTFYKEQLNMNYRDLVITENLSKRVLSLPMFPTLTTKEMDYITSSIAAYMESKRSQVDF